MPGGLDTAINQFDIMFPADSGLVWPMSRTYQKA